MKRVCFSLAPLIAILLVGEGAARLLGWNTEAASFGGDGVRPDSEVLRHDPLLGWSRRPNTRIVRENGLVIETNSLGLRSPEVGPKQPDEWRILSLGESTTYGIGVQGEDTYTAVAALLLDEMTPRRVTAVNAGIPAYSSYQSLRYLERRGLQLDPDLVLFYHEINDYFPSAVRDDRLSEVGVLMTDRQLYESRSYRLASWLHERSALFASLRNARARWRIRRLQAQEGTSPIGDIGLPQVQPSIVARISEPDLLEIEDVERVYLGRRVSDEERLENLETLRRLCERNGIGLVIIHPSYAASARHECLLTRFAEENGVPLFEAHDTLHPPLDGAEMFRDAWHPSAAGHAALARDLARFVSSRFF